MSVPTTTLTIAATKTAPAAMSLAALASGWRWGMARSTVLSMAVLIISAPMTRPKQKTSYHYQSGYVAFHISFFSEGCPDSFYGMFKHVNHGGPPSVYHNNDG